MQTGDGAGQPRAVVKCRVGLKRARVVTRVPPRGGHNLAQVSPHTVEHRLAKAARGERPARDLNEHRVTHLGPGKHRIKQPLADAPTLECIECDRQPVTDLVIPATNGDSEALAHERARRPFDERHQFVK